jgi:hypothetical protein
MGFGFHLRRMGRLRRLGGRLLRGGSRIRHGRRRLRLAIMDPDTSTKSDTGVSYSSARLPPGVKKLDVMGGRAGCSGAGNELRSWKPRTYGCLTLFRQLSGMDVLELSARIEQLRTQAGEVLRELEEARQHLASVRRQVVQTEEVGCFKRRDCAGLYEYQHPLTDVVAYKAEPAHLMDPVTRG